MLLEGYDKSIEYLRLSLNDYSGHGCYGRDARLNTAAEDSWLTFDEIERLVATFARLGTRRVRLGGGEPLLRRNVADLAARIACLPGIDQLSLDTNAARLDLHAAELHAAGVSGLNVSLDSLNRRGMQEITGCDSLSQILYGVMAAKAVGFAPITISMLIQPGVNEHQVDDMVAFCAEYQFVLRLRAAAPVKLASIKKRLREKFALLPQLDAGRRGATRYLATSDGRNCVGFTTPLAQQAWDAANLVSLEADGTLRRFNRQLALRPLLRRGASDAELHAAIRAALAHRVHQGKPAGAHRSAPVGV